MPRRNALSGLKKDHRIIHGGRDLQDHLVDHLVQPLIHQSSMRAGQHVSSHDDPTADHMGRISSAHMPRIHKLAAAPGFDAGIALI